MVDGALDAGLRVDQKRYLTECTLYDEHTRAPINHNAITWLPLSFATRPLGDGLVHATARSRPHLAGRPAYADDQWWWPYGGDGAPQPAHYPANGYGA